MSEETTTTKENNPCAMGYGNHVAVI